LLINIIRNVSKYLCINFGAHLSVYQFIKINCNFKEWLQRISLNSDSDTENDTEDDELYVDESDDVFQGFSEEFYESKEYSTYELECLKSIKLVIKKIKVNVKAFNQSNFLNHQLIATQKTCK